jgi:hypothetical protein
MRLRRFKSSRQWISHSQSLEIWWWSVSHYCFVFGGSQTPISGGRPIILTETSRVFPQYLHNTSAVVTIGCGKETGDIILKYTTKHNTFWTRHLQRGLHPWTNTPLTPTPAVPEKKVPTIARFCDVPCRKGHWLFVQRHLLLSQIF